jgi:hypothetical protein
MKKILIAIFALMVFGLTSHFVFAATITVTTTNPVFSSDSECSLLEALANAQTDTAGAGDCSAGSGADTIEFNIPGPGPHTIEVGNQVNISEDTTIDATTQPGTVCALDGGTRQLQINIDGSAISSSSNVFDIGPGEDNVTIKGLAIYGNSYGSGIANWANNLTVQCSNIGTDANGLTAYPNKTGISLYGDTTSGHLIGGPNPGDGNIISGNGYLGDLFDGSAISGAASNIVIQGNWVGIDSTGMTAMPNQGTGISLSNGGTLAQDSISLLDNVVSGNGDSDETDFSPGINIAAGDDSVSVPHLTNIIIKGNVVGLSADGSVALPNLSSGLFLGSHISGFQVGGTAAGEGNVFSGNGGPGLSLSYNIDDGVVQGNIIGLSSDESTAIPNGAQGIQMYDVDTSTRIRDITIGGSVSGAGNIIAGNHSDGISLLGEDITIAGNFIGTDSTGNTCFPNGSNGISIEQSSEGVIVGGDTAAERNIIGCNDGSGIYSKGNGVVLSGNYLGVGMDGTTVMENEGGKAIYFASGSGDAVVGGDTDAKGNIIANHSVAGIYIEDGTGSFSVQKNTITNNLIGILAVGSEEVGDPVVSILQNTITNNSGMGIDFGEDTDGDHNPDLYANEPNANDVGDSDRGVNAGLNYPVILSTVQDGGSTIVTYGLDVPVSPYPYHIEFFINPTDGVDPNGYGEGEVYEDYANVTVSASGMQVFTKTLSGVDLEDGIITTATKCADSLCTEFDGTSEFSNSAPPGVDYGTASGSQTLLSDNGAAHIINTYYLGNCVNGDSGDGENTDEDGPNQAGASIGSTPCTNDRDGVEFVTGDLVDLPGEVGDTVFVPFGEGELNDVTLSGSYTGDITDPLYIIFASLSPDNGLSGDEYYAFFNEQFYGPFVVDPGIPQLLFDGLYATVGHATGHAIFDLGSNEGPLWIAPVSAGTTGLSGDSPHADPYTPSELAYTLVTASDHGFIHVWLDKNNDGDFSDSGEHVVDNQSLAEGENAVTFNAPGAQGTFNVRFRFVRYSTPDLGPTGLAVNGEVEDYQMTVVAPDSGGDDEEDDGGGSGGGGGGGGSAGRAWGTIQVPNFPPLTTAKPPVSSVSDELLGDLCPSSLIVTDSMRVGDKNGRYSVYNKKIVTQVGILQSHINRILASAYKQAAGPVDGIFGPLTKQGVMRLQTALNQILKPNPPLKIDGIVGPFTRNAINHSCARTSQ